MQLIVKSPQPGTLVSVDRSTRQSIMHLGDGGEWNGRKPRTRIIAIGAHDGVDGAALREVFDRCRDATSHKAK
jgi:hypothetical protein